MINQPFARANTAVSHCVKNVRKTAVMEFVVPKFADQNYYAFVT